MEQTINLELTASEVNAILQLLGEQPTKTGAFVLLSKIKAQGDAQMSKPAPDAADPAPVAE